MSPSGRNRTLLSASSRPEAVLRAGARNLPKTGGESTLTLQEYDNPKVSSTAMLSSIGTLLSSKPWLLSSTPIGACKIGRMVQLILCAGRQLPDNCAHGYQNIGEASWPVSKCGEWNSPDKKTQTCPPAKMSHVTTVTQSANICFLQDIVLPFVECFYASGAR